MIEKDIDYVKKTEAYALKMRPVFKPSALFSDETANYVTPMEPQPGDRVKISFRTGKNNVDRVFWLNKGQRFLMELERSSSDFDYYKIEITAGEELIEYSFEIQVGKLVCFYDKQGISKEQQDYYTFSIAPGFKTPDWAKGAVMYQVMVDRFCNGDPTNDVEDREYFYVGDVTDRVQDWNKYPAFMGVREFYGGDLQGVMDKLDYLQDLGVDVLYFNPIFVSPSNHKYDIQDYDYVDPHYGKIVRDDGELLPEGSNENRKATKYIRRVTDKANLEASNELFIRLVEEVHKRGMKVILDGVFNHCGSFNKWMDRERIYENQEGYEKGAYVDAASPYRSFFHFRKNEWPYNNSYDGWWGYDTLPKMAYEDSDELFGYIMDIARKWVSPPFNADGWRLDVAADLGLSSEYNHKFWRAFRQAVKEANPEAVILAEHYGDAREWLKGDQWDTVMNYDAFMEPITWFFTGMEKHSDEYREDLLGNPNTFMSAMMHHMSRFLGPSLQISMNELSNHDHSRFLTRTNHQVGRIDVLGYEAASQGIQPAVMREAVVMQMTWPGAPTIYYGDEAGVTGFTDPDNRRTFPWGREDQEMIRFHREMIRIHKSNPVFAHGSLKFLESQWNSISYARFTESEQVVVAFNNDDREQQVSLSVWQAGVESHSRMELLIRTDQNGFTLEKEVYTVTDGKVFVTLPPFSAVVLRKE